MDFLSYLLQFFLSQLLAELFRPKPKISRPAAVGLKELASPTADENRCLPWLIGRAKQDAPNLTGTFDYFANPRSKNIRNGLGSSYSQPLGYDYYLGMSMTLCAGSGVRLREIWAGTGDDAVKIWSGNVTTGGTISLNYRKYDKSDNDHDYPMGFQGVVEFYSGHTTPSPYLVAKQGAGNVPSWPHATYVVLRGASTSSGMWVGTTGQMLPLSFVIERFPDAATYNPAGVSQPVGALNNNGTDANAAYVIAELLTDATFWAGEHPDFVDMTAFGQAALGCSTDGHYIGTLIDTQRTTGDVVLEFCRQIGGVLQPDPVTGQHALRLIRAGDTPVLALDDSNVVEVASFSRNSVDEATNQLSGSYLDRVVWQKRPLTTQQDLAAIKTAGSIIAGTAEYSSITDPSMGAKLLARDLRALSSPLAKARLTAIVEKRQRFLPGDLVTWTNSRLGIAGLGMRVTSARYTKPGENQCELELVEDVFGGGQNVYAAPLPVSHGPENVGSEPPPSAPPAAISSMLDGTFITSAPYALTGDNADHGLAMCFPPSSDARTYDINWYVNSDPTVLYQAERKNINFSVYGTLAIALSASGTPASITLNVNAANAAALARVQSRSVFVSIGFHNSTLGTSEMLQVGSFTLTSGGTQCVLAGITRGIWDTWPREFAVNTPVYIWLDFQVDEIPLATNIYSTSLTLVEKYSGQSAVGLKSMAHNILGDSPLSGAVDLIRGSDGFSSGGLSYARSAYPYGPGNIKLNGVLGGSLSTPATGVSVPSGGGPVTVAFNPRNRMARGLSPWATGDGLAEPNVVHEVSMYRFNGTGWDFLTAVVAGVGATSATLTFPSGIPRPAKVRIDITAQRPSGSTFIASAPQSWYWTVT
jgi:hypothetical protein